MNYGNYSRDICVQKNDTSRKCLLDQYSYDYFGERNALTGNREFDGKRFICIEMRETPGQKSEREAIERQEREEIRMYRSLNPLPLLFPNNHAMTREVTTSAASPKP